MTIENNDIYTIGFAEEEITLQEGMSAAARLSVSPTPTGADTVAFALSVSDTRQLTVEPEEVVFSAAGADIDVVVNVTEDIIPESEEETFAISITPLLEDIPVMIGPALSVIVPADNDTTMVRVFPERTVIPEGAAASVLIDAGIKRDLTVNLTASGLMSAQTAVSFSPPSLTLRPHRPSASFKVSVEDNEEPQGNDRTFNIDLSSTPAIQIALPSLTFTIPPNDLMAHAATRAEFALESEGATQTMTINITPPLQGGKSFIVTSEDPRLISGLTTPAQSPFPVELRLSALLAGEEPLNLNIIHLDSWPQRSAQEQLSAGAIHSCGIKADGAAACWGFDGHGRADPTSAAGVDANTGFLSVSAGDRHSCGIKADNTAACWGLDNFSQANPASAPGVDADTGFLALSAGASHSCGIKADSAAACWGFDGYGRTDPTSAAGVGVNAIFLSISAGSLHSCGIKADSAAVCWGFGGDGRTDPTSAPGVNADARFLAVSAGRSHSCAIRADSSLACWGVNDDNQASPTSAPGVDADTKFLAVSAGRLHSCGIKINRTVACWGRNDSDQADPASASGVDADTRFLAVSSGRSHSCGIKEDGSVACWGLDGNGQASPPPNGFSRTQDIFRLAEKTAPLTTQDGEAAVRLERSLDLPHTQLTLHEGETTTLALFSVLSAPASPVTVTLRIRESDRRFLILSPERFKISEAGEVMVTLTAIDNDDIAVIDPISVTLSAEGDALPTPIGMTTVTVINDDYIIGFERRTITLKEGMSASVRLDIPPALLSSGRVTVALRPSDNGQIAADPRQITFFRNRAVVLCPHRACLELPAKTNMDITVSAKEDNIAEPERTFTVKLIFEEDITPAINPAFINTELSVIVPADEISARVLAERTVIPEGETASVLIDAFTFHDLNVTMALSETSDQTGISLSGSSLRLNADNPSGAFNIFIEDNGEPQANDRTFAVDLSSAPALRPDLPSSLTFTIPPNDLTAYASTRVEFTLEEPEQTMMVNITPPLQGDKSFIVSSEDPRLIVKAGLITPAQSSFPIELALSEDKVLGREELPGLNIIHLDSWRQRSAQAQISAGGEHSCGIREDGEAVCWGFDESGQANPLSANGVRVNTRFLALSAGDSHTCGIKANNTAVCWGFDGNGEASPTASPHGVNANTRFLSLSAGHLHTCGIKANNTVACWGDNGNNQSDPLSAAGVNANTRFLALSAGAFHTCGIKANNTAVCWGFDGNGQASPRGADADARFLSLSAGSFHTCGIKAGNTAACWGHNGNGEANPTGSAQGVDADTRFLALSAGGDLRGGHSCGIKEDGAVACWGADGHNRSNPTNGFQGVDANTVFLALSAGAEHTCGIKTDGAAACWGSDRRGQASPPSGGFARTFDVIMLAESATALRTQEGGEPVQFVEVTDIEVLHPQLMLREGETAALRLFRVLSGAARPVTVTLAIEESDERFLSFSPAQLRVNEKGGTATVSVTAVNNENVADIEPIAITLSLTGGNTRLTPTETITVSIEEDDFYTIAFDREAITLEEGMSETVRLSISPAPSAADTVTVALSVSDSGQLAVNPEEVIFSATAARFDVAVSVTDDIVAEPEETFTVSLTPQADIPAIISSELSVIALADSDTPTARVFVGRTVIPEGTTVSVFIDAALNRELIISMSLSEPMNSQADISLSSTSLTLSPNAPTVSFSILVEDDEEPQQDNRTFNVGLTATPALQSALSTLTFTVPPNDLTAYAITRVEFTLENKEAVQTITINTTPTLQGDKSFIVFSEDPRIMVKTGLIAPSQHLFPVELTLSEEGVLGREESLSLSISHLDSWRQRSAQAQLSAGDAHSCAIKADGAVVCWGSNDNNRASPMSSPQGVDANAMFLAVSAGGAHSCGIKADSRVACWGDNDNGQADPTSSPQGVDADTGFIAISAGDGHTCGIKADSAVVCWGDNDNAQADPTSADGVNANTGFLALSAGGAHSCGIKADSRVACWGDNDNGQADPTSGPRGVNANTRFLALSAGGAHSCGIKADSRVACWGDNDNGQADPTSSPQGVDADTGFIAISAGGAPADRHPGNAAGGHTCGIRADGGAACWGLNSDERINPASAVAVSANTKFLALSAGGAHNCAIKADGAAACWGVNSAAQASPPPDDLSQTPDVFRLAERSTTLATQDDGEPVQFVEVTDVEVLHPQLSLNEGETTALTLFRLLSGPARPVTVTLEIKESDERFLRVSSTQFTISEAGGAATASITADDSDDFVAIDPIDIMLSITGDNARLTPTEIITVAIEKNNAYTIGFDRPTITLEEGASANARLSISPRPTGDSAAAVALSVSDKEQLTVEPETVVFSATTARFDVAVAVTDDNVAEAEKTFTVSLTPLANIAAAIGDELSVIVPDNDAPTVRARAERTVIPEGETASVLIAADLVRELTVNLALSGSVQNEVRLSSSSLTLGPDKPSALFTVLVADNDAPQATNEAFNVDLTSMFSPRPALPSLTFTVPPNDLRAEAAARVEFTLDNQEAAQTMTVGITPPLRGDKSFIVFSEDPRITATSGIITPDQSSFSVELALVEGLVLGREERLNLSISHLDGWRQRSAQAQLSAGGAHSCGIKADGAAACWGSDGGGRSSPTSSPQIDVNAGFLALSAGGSHTCAIKADSSLACWGLNNNNQADPLSGPRGVDANARFLSLSAGSFHTCGIKADDRVACWGLNSNNQANPMSSPQGVDANTRFLALSAGLSHSCAIKADSALACWGDNGDNQANPMSSPQGVDANTRFVALSGGWSHTCGIKADGRVACWGSDDNRQTDPMSAPQGVDANTRFIAISAGGGPSDTPGNAAGGHSCGIKTDGGVACWGSSAEGQTDPTGGPRGAAADTRFLAVSCGALHSCGIKEDGAVACWGNDGDGQASPPPDDFARSSDVIRLVERTTALMTAGGEEAVRFNEVTEVGPLHLRLRLDEGETTTLALFRALSGPASPVTITLAIKESDKQFISVRSTQLVINEAGGTATATITALNNDDFVGIDPIGIALRHSGRQRPIDPH